MGRAGTTRKRLGASIADIRAVRGGLGYGGSDGSGTPAGRFAVVDSSLVSTQEGINRFTPRASARLTLLAANSGFGGLPSRSLDVPVVGFVSVKTYTPNFVPTGVGSCAHHRRCVGRPEGLLSVELLLSDTPLRRASGIGASCSLPLVPAKVCFMNA